MFLLKLNKKIIKKLRKLLKHKKYKKFKSLQKNKREIKSNMKVQKWLNNKCKML